MIRFATIIQKYVVVLFCIFTNVKSKKQGHMLRKGYKNRNYEI